jgi:hypothetical protein
MAAHKLTDAEWDELVQLIADSPTGRMDEALKRMKQMAVGRRSSNRQRWQPRSTEEWLVHLASISPGPAFDRALLTELRRLSLQ